MKVVFSYPYETIMEEHPQEPSWDFGVKFGGTENSV